MARDQRKETASKGKTKAQNHSATTEAHKRNRVQRVMDLAGRPDNMVSANCLKHRQKRRRLRAYRKDVKAGLKFVGSPSELGERQFGDTAAGWHIHQRDNGLATALTPEEFRRQETKRKQDSQDKIEYVETEA